MQRLICSCLFVGSLLPLAAQAQTDPTASPRQLPAEALAVLTPTTPGGAERGSRVYTGAVLNEAGQPLAGAQVSIGPDRDQVTVTNAEGIYTLHSAAAVPLLRVTYAGYEEASLRLATPQPVTFNLEPIDNYRRQLRKQTKAAVKAFYNK